MTKYFCQVFFDKYNTKGVRNPDAEISFKLTHRVYNFLIVRLHSVHLILD